MVAIMAAVWGMFQHTAARRRLVIILQTGVPGSGFNTQPPEGGWINR